MAAVCGALSAISGRRLTGRSVHSSRASVPPRRALAVVPQALFKGNPFAKKAPKAAPAPKRETVIPEPSYNIPITLLGLAGVSGYEGVVPAAAIFGILGLFLTVQASRVKFVFYDDALEVVIGEQKDKSENAFVGGENRWAYDSFTNWEFWWPAFPCLVYFKETQTKPEGQIHFFPIIFNGKQVYDVMVERCGESQTSGPKN